MIFPTEGLGQVMDGLERAFGSLAIRPIHAFAGRPAHRLVITARKAGRSPTRMLPGLVLQTASGAASASAS